MRNFTALEVAYDRYMESQLPGGGRNDKGQELFNCAEHWLPRIEMELAGRTVLDVGTGDGDLAGFFTDRHWLYTGIDLYKRPGINVVVGDYHFLGILGEFDLVFCSHTLEHSIFPYFSVSRLYDFTKEDGRCIVVVPEYPSMTANPGHYSVLSKEAWIKIAMENGFEIHDVLSVLCNGSSELRFLLGKK